MSNSISKYCGTAQWGESFFKQTSVAIVIVFLAEMGRIPCCGRPKSSSSNIWYDKPFWCVKLCAWSHAKCLSLLALGFTHQKGLSYQIFELEDSGLPQQGILPISARKTTTKAIHRCLEKTLSTVPAIKLMLRPPSIYQGAIWHI